jgi:hypothetical protein
MKLAQAEDRLSSLLEQVLFLSLIYKTSLVKPYPQ